MVPKMIQLANSPFEYELSKTGDVASDYFVETSRQDASTPQHAAKSGFGMRDRVDAQLDHEVTIAFSREPPITTHVETEDSSDYTRCTARAIRSRSWPVFFAPHRLSAPVAAQAPLATQIVIMSTEVAASRIHDMEVEGSRTTREAFPQHLERKEMISSSSNCGASPTSFIPFPTITKLPETPPRRCNPPSAGKDTATNGEGDTLPEKRTSAASRSSDSGGSLRSDSESPSRTVLLTPCTPLASGSHACRNQPVNGFDDCSAGSGNRASCDVLEGDHAISAPRIVITRASEDHRSDYEGRDSLFMDSPSIEGRQETTTHLDFGTDDPRSAIDVDFSRSGRPVARIIQYEVSSPEGFEGERAPCPFKRDVCFAAVVQHPDVFLKAQSGDVGSSPPCRVEILPLEVSTLRGLEVELEHERGYEQSPSPTSSAVEDPPASPSSKVSSARNQAITPVEMVPLKAIDGASEKPTRGASGKRRSSGLLKTKSSMDRLSRGFAEGFSKTCAVLTGRGSKSSKEGFKADMESYRSEEVECREKRWGIGSPPATSFALTRRGSQDSGFSWSPSILRRTRATNGGENRFITAPATPSKVRRGRLPSFRLSFPYLLSDNNDSPQPKATKVNLSASEHRSRCVSEESWGNAPLDKQRSEVVNSHGQDGTGRLDAKTLRKHHPGLRPAHSLHLLRSGVAWGAMRRTNGLHSRTPTTRRSPSPSSSSLSVSISDSSLTMYASHVPPLVDAADEERYKQLARLEALAILEGKVRRRASGVWCGIDSTNEREKCY